MAEELLKGEYILKDSVSQAAETMSENIDEVASSAESALDSVNAMEDGIKSLSDVIKDMTPELKEFIKLLKDPALTTTQKNGLVTGFNSLARAKATEAKTVQKASEAQSIKDTDDAKSNARLQQMELDKMKVAEDKANKEQRTKDKLANDREKTLNDAIVRREKNELKNEETVEQNEFKRAERDKDYAQKSEQKKQDNAVELEFLKEKLDLQKKTTEETCEIQTRAAKEQADIWQESRKLDRELANQGTVDTRRALSDINKEDMDYKSKLKKEEVDHKNQSDLNKRAKIAEMRAAEKKKKWEEEATTFQKRMVEKAKGGGRMSALYGEFAKEKSVFGVLKNPSRIFEGLDKMGGRAGKIGKSLAAGAGTRAVASAVAGPIVGKLAGILAGGAAGGPLGMAVVGAVTAISAGVSATVSELQRLNEAVNAIGKERATESVGLRKKMQVSSEMFGVNARDIQGIDNQIYGLRNKEVQMTSQGLDGRGVVKSMIEWKHLLGTEVGGIKGAAFKDDDEVYKFARGMAAITNMNGMSEMEQQSMNYQTTQIMSKGYADMQDIKPLLNSAPGFMNILKRQNNISSSEVLDMSSSRTFTADMIKNAVLELNATMSVNAASASSRTSEQQDMAAQQVLGTAAIYDEMYEKSLAESNMKVRMAEHEAGIMKQIKGGFYAIFSKTNDGVDGAENFARIVADIKVGFESVLNTIVAATRMLWNLLEIAIECAFFPATAFIELMELWDSFTSAIFLSVTKFFTVTIPNGFGILWAKVRNAGTIIADVFSNLVDNLMLYIYEKTNFGGINDKDIAEIKKGMADRSSESEAIMNARTKAADDAAAERSENFRIEHEIPRATASYINEVMKAGFTDKVYKDAQKMDKDALIAKYPILGETLPTDPSKVYYDTLLNHAAENDPNHVLGETGLKADQVKLTVGRKEFAEQLFKVLTQTAVDVSKGEIRQSMKTSLSNSEVDKALQDIKLDVMLGPIKLVDLAIKRAFNKGIRVDMEDTYNTYVELIKSRSKAENADNDNVMGIDNNVANINENVKKIAGGNSKVLDVLKEIAGVVVVNKITTVRPDVYFNMGNAGAGGGSSAVDIRKATQHINEMSSETGVSARVVK